MRDFETSGWWRAQGFVWVLPTGARRRRFGPKDFGKKASQVLAHAHPLLGFARPLSRWSRSDVRRMCRASIRGSGALFTGDLQPRGLVRCRRQIMTRTGPNDARVSSRRRLAAAALCHVSVVPYGSPPTQDALQMFDRYPASARSRAPEAAVHAERRAVNRGGS